MISIIVPCYNEEAALPYFFTEIRKVADNMTATYELCFEFIFVNDGSKDGTLNLLREFAAEDNRVRYISFSRNFGKEAAMYAGFQHAAGDFAVLMDADLQHPPDMLEEMYLAITEEGFDIAAARRVSRKGEPPIRSFFARCFYRLINKISRAEFVDGASDFRMLSRRAADALLEMREYNRFSKGIFGWVGFQTKWIPYENVERVAGETNWSFWKLFLYSLDGIIAFSTAPLTVAFVVGVLFCLAAFIGIVIIVVKTLIWGDPVAGFPTLACLLLLIGGSIQLSLGIIGQYLAKTYLETKRRPVYIIAETNGEYAAEAVREGSAARDRENQPV
jgi:glycosyltransferase involved in cell wall biosynthesis